MQKYIRHTNMSEGYALFMADLFHASSLKEAQKKTAKRRFFLKKFEVFAEGGKVAAVEGGRDCDGVSYEGKVHIIDANAAAYQVLCDEVSQWADGPFWFELMKPSEAEAIEYGTRDLMMEAFEDGHAHCLHV